MKLKLDDKNQVVVQDGKPVYVHDDGKEAPFDVIHTLATITRLNGEAKSHRERAETAEGKLKAFEGIEDPESALKAMETVKNLEQGELVTAGKVEEIKTAAKKAAEEQVAAATKAGNDKLLKTEKERDTLRGELFSEKVGGAFTRSAFAKDKIAVPPDMMQAMFGHRFKIENGKVVGYGLDNQPIYSRSRHGEIADFDEALESMVEAYPSRDNILKGTGASGGGANPSHSVVNGKKTMTRAQYEAIDPMNRASETKGVTIVD